MKRIPKLAILALLLGMVKFALPVLALLTIGIASAQDALPSVDPHAWGASPFALAAVVLFVTASLKRAADRKGLTFTAWIWWTISLTLGILGAWVLNLLGYGATLGTLAYPWAVVLYGVVAGLSASGFRDLAKTVSDWYLRPKAPALPATVGEILPPAGVIQPAPGNGLERL
jgi:hypothetical protein